MPAGLRIQSRIATPTKFARAVKSVVTATGKRRASPTPRNAPGRTYFSPTTSIAGAPSSSPTAAIATPPASVPARGPPSVTATATGISPTAIATSPPPQPHEEATSMPVKTRPKPVPSRTARRVSGAEPTRGVLFGDVGDEGDRAKALERGGELTLVPCAVAGDSARDDLAALRHEGAEALDVAVVHGQDLVDAELAHLASAEPTPLHGLDHLVASSLFADRLRAERHAPRGTSEGDVVGAARGFLHRLGIRRSRRAAARPT